MKIFIIATVPDDLAHAWFQHLRNFDTTHPDCHFNVVADAAEMQTDDMVKALAIDPSFNFMHIMKRK